MVLTAAVGFALMPIFAELAYSDGANPVGLLTVRFIAAAVILVPAQRLLGGHIDITGRGPLFLAFVALFGAQSFCFFASVERSGAALAVLLLFTYPLLTAAASAVIFRERLGAARLSLLVTGFAGVVLSVGGASRSVDAIGLVLGLGASVGFATAMLIAKRMLSVRGGASEMMALAYALCSPLFAVLYGVSDASLPHGASGWAAIAGVVLVGTVGAMGLFFAGLHHLPAGTAAMLSMLEPPIAVLFAGIFLHEPIGAPRVLGVALVVGSILVITRLDTDIADGDFEAVH